MVQPVGHRTVNGIRGIENKPFPCTCKNLLLGWIRSPAPGFGRVVTSFLQAARAATFISCPFSTHRARRANVSRPRATTAAQPAPQASRLEPTTLGRKPEPPTNKSGSSWAEHAAIFRPNVYWPAPPPLRCLSQPARHGSRCKIFRLPPMC